MVYREQKEFLFYEVIRANDPSVVRMRHLIRILEITSVDVGDVPHTHRDIHPFLAELRSKARAEAMATIANEDTHHLSDPNSPAD